MKNLKVTEIKKGSFSFSHVEKTPWYRRNKQWWKIEEPYLLTIEFDDHTASMEVEEGYLTDGASVPRILWSLFPPHGPYSAAAFFHDKQYKLKGLVMWRSKTGSLMTKKWSRRRADQMFKLAMIHLELPKFKANTMYQAVRRFGRWREK